MIVDGALVIGYTGSEYAFRITEICSGAIRLFISLIGCFGTCREIPNPIYIFWIFYIILSIFDFAAILTCAIYGAIVYTPMWILWGVVALLVVMSIDLVLTACVFSYYNRLLESNLSSQKLSEEVPNSEPDTQPTAT